MNFNGNIMNRDLVSNTLNELKNHPNFKEIEEKIQQKGLSIEDLNVVLGYHFNTRHPLAEDVQYTRYLLLQDNEHSAQLAFTVTETINSEKKFEIITNLREEEKNNGTKVVTQSILQNNELIVKELHFDAENYNQLFKEPQVEEDDNFVPFEEPIRAQFPFDFCAPGGYEHCGPECGVGGTYGGGLPINATDACCQGHDVCWINFGDNDPCCDAEFLNCLEGQTNPTAIVARNYFSFNALRC